MDKFTIVFDDIDNSYVKKNNKLRRIKSNERQCSKCRIIKNLNEFQETKNKKGVSYKRRICKTCVFIKLKRKRKGIQLPTDLTNKK